MKLQVTVTEETLLRITQLLLDRDAWKLCALEVATQTVHGVYPPLLSMFFWLGFARVFFGSSRFKMILAHLSPPSPSPLLAPFLEGEDAGNHGDVRAEVRQPKGVHLYHCLTQFALNQWYSNYIFFVFFFFSPESFEICSMDTLMVYHVI